MNLNNHTPSQTHLQQKKKKITLQGLKNKKINPSPLFFIPHLTHSHNHYALIHSHIQSSPAISEPALLDDCSRSPNHNNP